MDKISIAPEWVFSPQPMYIIGTKNEDGTPNFCIITWLGFSFDNGPHLMMTVGGTKLTKINILREKKFSANMITEDNLWLADYFGNTNGEDGEKNAVPYSYERGKLVDVPVLNECHWSYECEVTSITELDGAHLFLAAIKNIQIDKKYESMDMKKIDLTNIRPVIYAPYNYFSIGEKLGEMGEWKKHSNETHIDFTKITACGESCVECKKKQEGVCQGCIESDGHCVEWTESDGCPIHKCARTHNVQFCGLCNEFPCE